MMLSPEDVKCGLFQADRPSADASDHCGAVAGEGPSALCVPRTMTPQNRKAPEARDWRGCDISESSQAQISLLHAIFF